MRSRNRNIFEKHGSLFFVTSTVVGFIKIFEDDSLYDIMINNLEFYQKRGDFVIVAYVLMPNHFHLILRPNKCTSISQCIGNFKRITSRQITEGLKDLGKTNLLAHLRHMAALESSKDTRIWKPRFDCFVLTNEDTLRQKIDYIHNNPVKDGLVDDACDWPYSSARNYCGFSNVGLRVDVEWKCLEHNHKPSGRGS